MERRQGDMNLSLQISNTALYVQNISLELIRGILNNSLQISNTALYVQNISLELIRGILNNSGLSWFCEKLSHKPDQKESNDEVQDDELRPRSFIRYKKKNDLTTFDLKHRKQTESAVKDKPREPSRSTAGDSFRRNKDTQGRKCGYTRFKLLLGLSAFCLLILPANSLQVELANQTIQFGKEAHLNCSFQQSHNDQTRLMQWYKGYEQRLTQGNISTNAEKYKTDLTQGESSWYILTIYNFSVSDFGTYVCHHNFDKEPFNLLPEQIPFVYVPSDEDITASVTDDGRFKNVTFDIGLVYPKPSCSCTSNSVIENLPTIDDEQRSIDGHLYRIIKTVFLQKAATTCAYKIHLKCSLGGVRFMKTVPINGSGCQGKNRYTVSYVVTGICVFIIMVIGIIVLGYRKRKYRSERKRENIKENQPLTNNK